MTFGELGRGQTQAMMKKIAMVLVLGMMAVGCHAQVKVQAKSDPPPAAPPKQEEPAKEPEPEPVKAGEQIVLPDQIEFELNESRIKETPKTLETLNKLAEIMKKQTHVTKLRIEGHTDNAGSAKLNKKLSKARADAVAKWLGEHEVDDKRLVTVGFGASKPLKPNTSADNRATNRRTEYYVDELDGKKVGDDGKKFEGKPAEQKPAAVDTKSDSKKVKTSN
jgi:outer membrane protein OmpA-like peptidoglycan-associated protein